MGPPERAGPLSQREGPSASSNPPLHSTADLLALARAGDARARDRLLQRYLPALTRWAHGRLPSAARDLVDTDDIVQETLVSVLNRLEEFESRHQGALLAYLRQALLNRIRNEARRAGRQPERGAMPEGIAHGGVSQLERILGREALERYESALATLSPREQETIVMRVEMGFTHQEIADAIGSPSWNAARMVVSRALLRLAEALHGKEQRS